MCTQVEPPFTKKSPPLAEAVHVYQLSKVMIILGSTKTQLWVGILFMSHMMSALA